MRTLIGAVAGIVCLASPAFAEPAAAIVEDVQGKVEGVEFMDYVAPGKIIKLGPKATLVLGYLKSCWRETITGGVVQVGPEQSTVQLGDVQRVKVPCDANAVQLSEHEANQGAATTYRSIELNSPGSSATIYGVSPLIEAKGGGTLVIERTDAREPQLSVPLKNKILVHGRFYDLAKAGKALTPGGTYRASIGPRHFTFQVDATATSSPGSIVGRLLRFD